MACASPASRTSCATEATKAAIAVVGAITLATGPTSSSTVPFSARKRSGKDQDVEPDGRDQCGECRTLNTDDRHGEDAHDDVDHGCDDADAQEEPHRRDR
jgi:hypothetical protein